MKRISLSLILLFAMMIISCKKDAGEGGQSTITGNVWVRDYDDTFTTLEAQYPAQDEWVYIVYGDDKGYGNRQNTTYNGTFEFKYLRPGKYTLYVYSKDSTMLSHSGKVAVVKTVEIKNRKETVEVHQFIIFK